MKYSAVILAAGKGVRMGSSIPKIVHKVAGKPIITYLVDAVIQSGIKDIVLVVGHGREMVYEIFSGYDIRFVTQEQQLGTGHALLKAEPAIEPDSNILVLAGDTPLLRFQTINSLLEYHQRSGATASVLTARLENPFGYGRIIRNPDSSLSEIVEEKDATAEQKMIKEINTGIYCFAAREVFPKLKQLDCDNAQGEYYLTDVLKMLNKENKEVGLLLTEASEEIYGINDRVQLSVAERILRNRKNDELMRSGVTIIDPASTFIDQDVTIGRDTIIFPQTMIEGKTVIGEKCEIGPGTRISNSTIENGVIIEYSRIKSAIIGESCTIGPYAYIRPETVLHKNVKVGDFVEVKKSIIGECSKIPHLSYVGDAVVGKNVNIGAGTITCNYDGKNKWQTILEDNVFIGSNTNLVAPVKLGANSMTGAGSTITKDIPPNSLGVERAKQKTIENWVLKRKESN
ncbi:MAG: bifunctional UDP-N-acetylglucosamine diphosphorylase/glucosamine-1-phosphate N-acetyltransferase GlmU [Syntrophomonadaceae bacterium]